MDSNTTGAYSAYLAFQSVSGDNLGGSDGFNDGGECNGDSVDGSDLPGTTLACLLRYGQSENVSERQVAVRHVLKALQSLEASEQLEDVEQVFALVRDRFAEDSDPLIRAELVEQLPMLCMNCQQTPGLQHKIDTVLIPLLAKFLDDLNTQVRKTCQAAIVILLEQDLLSAEALQGLICPALLSLATPVTDRSDDVRLETVGLLCKIVTSSAVSLDWAYNVFLGKFTSFLQDPVFHIRKVCASSLGDISRMFGRELTEQVVVPHLLTLSQDSVWGVRKACAEVYTDVSNNCSMTIRRNHLAPKFIMLLADPSRWVSSQAFQTLGPFIATFANSNRTGLDFRDGTLTYHEPSNSEDDFFRSSSDERPISTEPSLPPGAVVPDIVPVPPPTIERPRMNEEDIMTELRDLLDGWSPPEGSSSNGDQPTDERQPDSNGSDDDSSMSVGDSSSNVRPSQLQLNTNVDDKDHRGWTGRSDPTSNGGHIPSVVEPAATAESGDSSAPSASTEDVTYSSFNYWQPTYDPTVVDEDASTSGTRSSTADGSEDIIRNFMERRFDSPSTPTSDAAAAVGKPPASQPITIMHKRTSGHADSNSGTSSLFSQPGSTRSLDREHQLLSQSPPPTPPREFEYQDIIPQPLLDNFISMVEPSRAQLIETDISRHCAHNFPAVAYTLGRKHWPRIKGTYVALANDMQWRVRQTLAFSIHEMAAILGEEYTTADLLPVFQGFLRDLDEVRVGVLRHLYDFFKLLSPNTRKTLLKVLADFLQTDNTKNWRFRHEFTRQCTMLCDLYDIDDINTYIAAIGLTLATDRIADIRKEAAVLLATILGRFVETEECDESGNMNTTKSFIDDIVKGFAVSVRWLRRQTYCAFCEKVLERRLVKETLFAELLLDPLLALANDRIPNVRLGFARAISAAGLEFFTGDRLQRVEEALKRMTSDVDCDCRLLSKQALGMDVDGLFTDSVFESFVSPDSRDSSLGDLSATNIPSMTHLSSYSPMSDDEKSHPTAIISVEPLSSESSLSDDEDSNMRVDEASSEC